MKKSLGVLDPADKPRDDGKKEKLEKRLQGCGETWKLGDKLQGCGETGKLGDKLQGCGETEKLGDKSPAFSLATAHPSWHACLRAALNNMDSAYLQQLAAQKTWLPGPNNIFNAFSLPVSQVNYLLLGESPYPRADSANGYAFWDAAVQELWSPQGMSKKVNRATSLRNLFKMLLVAEGLLQAPHFSQPDILSLDKSGLVQTNTEFFTGLLNQGFLLLNASLVLHPLALAGQVRKDARAWQPFLQTIIHFLLEQRPQVAFLLFGKVAALLEELLPQMQAKKLCAEHPYNHSFISNPAVLQFFRPLHLLRKAC